MCMWRAGYVAWACGVSKNEVRYTAEALRAAVLQSIISLMILVALGGLLSDPALRSEFEEALYTLLRLPPPPAAFL